MSSFQLTVYTILVTAGLMLVAFEVKIGGASREPNPKTTVCSWVRVETENLQTELNKTGSR